MRIRRKCVGIRVQSTLQATNRVIVVRIRSTSINAFTVFETTRCPVDLREMFPPLLRLHLYNM